jgi:hypothetical protein
MQTKLSSFHEALISTFVGFVISLLIQQFIINPGWGLKIGWSGSLEITAIFTVASVLRSYFLRRLFNRRISNEPK